MTVFEITQFSPALFKLEHRIWLDGKVEQLCQGALTWRISHEELLERAEQRLEGAELERFRLSIQLIVNVSTA